MYNIFVVLSTMILFLKINAVIIKNLKDDSAVNLFLLTTTFGFNDMKLNKSKIPLKISIDISSIAAIY
jgi:hypothetical protein